MLITLLVIATIIIIFAFAFLFFTPSETNRQRRRREYNQQQHINEILKDFHPHCMNCGYTLLHQETTCPRCGVPVQIPPEELSKQQNQFVLKQNGWFQASQKIANAGNKIDKVGRSAGSFGKTMTIWVTIPILIIFVILLFFL